MVGIPLDSGGLRGGRIASHSPYLLAVSHVDQHGRFAAECIHLRIDHPFGKGGGDSSIDCSSFEAHSPSVISSKIFGPSIALLKAPLVPINVLAVTALYVMLRRSARLDVAASMLMAVR